MSFNELLKNMKKAWKKSEMKRIELESEIPEKTLIELIEDIEEFKEKANSATHNIYNLINSEDRFLELNIIHFYEGMIDIYNSIK